MVSWKDNNLLRESYVLRVGSDVYRPFTGKMTLDNYAYSSLIRLKRDPAKTPQEIKDLDPRETWLRSKKTGEICKVGYEKQPPYRPGHYMGPSRVEVYDDGSEPNLYTFEELLQYFELLDGSPCGALSLAPRNSN